MALAAASAFHPKLPGSYRPIADIYHAAKHASSQPRLYLRLLLRERLAHCEALKNLNGVDADAVSHG